jgi:hypothetical protein
MFNTVGCIPYVIYRKVHTELYASSVTAHAYGMPVVRVCMWIHVYVFCPWVCVCVCLLSVCVCVSECVCASHAHSSCIRYGRCPCTECEFVCVCCLFVWVCVCLLSVYCVHFCQCVCGAQLWYRLPWPEISDTPRIRNYNGDVWNIYQLDIYISCGKH